MQAIAVTDEGTQIHGAEPDGEDSLGASGRGRVEGGRADRHQGRSDADAGRDGDDDVPAVRGDERAARAHGAEIVTESAAFFSTRAS